MHVDKASRLYKTTVLTWILDERIIGKIEWTPVLTGRHVNWRQQQLIKSIFAACEYGTRRLEDWVGKSPYARALILAPSVRLFRDRLLMCRRGSFTVGGEGSEPSEDSPPRDRQELGASKLWTRRTAKLS